MNARPTNDQEHFEEIPTIDLTPWFEGEGAVKQRLADEVRAVCERVGFLYVRGHRVPEPITARAFAEARRFFALPMADKNALNFEKTGRQRGYIPLRAESTDPQAAGDLKEAFDATYRVAAGDLSAAARRRMSGENLWPDRLPGFRRTAQDYMDAMVRLGGTLFEIFAAGLGLDEGFFRDKIDRPIGQFRMLRYPPASGRADDQSPGIGAHCDYECLTLLATEGRGGLQVRNRAGEWVEAPGRPGALIINIGEMMQRWTNDLFKATPHRVINRSGGDRYSIPFFFGTNYDAVIECLPTCRSPDRPARYAPVLAGEYLVERLAEIYGTS